MSNISGSPSASTKCARLIAAAGVTALAVSGAIVVSTGSTHASTSDHRADVPISGSMVRLGPSSIYNAPNAQDREDIVQASFTPISQADQVRFVLRTPPTVTWWKGVRLADRTGNTLASDFTQDAKHHTKVLTVGRAAVTKGVYIVFSKAKTFGVHTDMYTVPVPTGDLGYQINIDWIKDSYPS